ncbi:hypothetical protein [Paenibacillus xylanexedens]|uniref:hypothetical protein n=1 Tax=Paenibacillus xylanexedens TaxID=528191 RepID=UPI0016425C3C|nr:hypothetical protein [Paenibacillus xylanexedens]
MIQPLLEDIVITGNPVSMANYSSQEQKILEMIFICQVPLASELMMVMERIVLALK